MENSEEKSSKETQENTHPQPGADPGAAIETVIPSAEQDITSAEDGNQQPETERKDDSIENDNEVKDIDVKDDEVQEEDSDTIDTEEDDAIDEKDEENIEPSESNPNTDEHGIETITP